MKSLKKEMDKVKIDSYKDCVWYLEDEDKCKMPGVGVSVSECSCKENMDEFCVWLTKFFKACPTDDDDRWFECDCGECGLGSVCEDYSNPTILDFNRQLKEDSFSDIIGRFVTDLKKKILR